ncbi:hypothetical protein YC2023_087342 [Brassica napus]
MVVSRVSRTYTMEERRTDLSHQRRKPLDGSGPHTPKSNRSSTGEPLLHLTNKETENHTKKQNTRTGSTPWLESQRTLAEQEIR